MRWNPLKWLLDFLRRKRKPQTAYSELHETVKEHPEFRGRNRCERRMIAHMKRPRRGKVRQRLRREHLRRVGSVRQRVLARLDNHRLTQWQRAGRPEEFIDRLAKDWGIR